MGPSVLSTLAQKSVKRLGHPMLSTLAIFQLNTVLNTTVLFNNTAPGVMP